MTHLWWVKSEKSPRNGGIDCRCFHFYPKRGFIFICYYVRYIERIFQHIRITWALHTWWDTPFSFPFYDNNTYIHFWSVIFSSVDVHFISLQHYIVWAMETKKKTTDFSMVSTLYQKNNTTKQDKKNRIDIEKLFCINV